NGGKGLGIAAFALLNSNSDSHADRPISDAIVIKRVLRGICARRNAFQQRSRHLLGIILQFFGGTMNTRQAVSFADVLQTSRSSIARSDLRAEIAFTLLGRTDIGN